MITFATLKDKPRQFLAMTSITLKEFLSLLPIFAEEYAARRSLTHTQEGKPRQRKAGGGNTARLVTIEDKLLFILIYQKTYPLQTAHGLQFGLGQPQTNEWVHRLMPVLNKTLERLGYAPERDPAAFAQSEATADTPPALQIDGTERRRQRPKSPKKQGEHYSGKKSPYR
jgi:hypothetical protein